MYGCSSQNNRNSVMTIPFIFYASASSSFTQNDSMHLFQCTHSWGKEGLRKGSESLPLTTLVLRCLGSDVEATEREGDAGFGGFLLASSFLCRSMSSRCWLMPSCCLHREEDTEGKRLGHMEKGCHRQTALCLSPLPLYF